MNIFIGYRSAFEFWRKSDPPSSARSSRACPVLGKRINKRVLERFDVQRFGIDGTPVHIIVASANDRSQAKCLACHLWSGEITSGGFVRVTEGLYVESPEATFVHMAAELPIVELVRFGYELCGTYVYEQTGDGFRKRLHGSPTTIEALGRYVEKMHGRRGVSKAARALRYIAGGSASPMETNLSLALCLPRMLGGYGLDLPQLNFRIEARTARGFLGRNYFECDLYWAKSKVAIEYDSDQFHEGADAQTHDSSRRSGLLIRDVLVITVTTDQFFDARKLDEVARALAKRLGKRLPANNASWMMKRHKLRAELLKDVSRNR